MKPNLTSNQVITTLNLEQHCEGGYFKRTFYSDKTVITEDQKTRRQLSSIYYLLTKDSHISVFAKNNADLIMYYHYGDPLKVIILEENGEASEKILGPNILEGHEFQIQFKTGTCKAYDLMAGEFCLISEAVGPGFEYEDMMMPSFDELSNQYPKHLDIIKRYT